MTKPLVSNDSCSVEIDTLGIFDIRYLGDRVSLSGRKTRAMLAYLALAPSAKASRQRIADLLWGDRGEVQARASLRQSLSEVRASLADSGLLLATRAEVALHPGTFVTDIEQIIEAAERADTPRLAACLDRVRGGLLDDLGDVAEVFDEWVVVERSHQHEIIVTRSVKALVSMPHLFTSADFLTVLRALDRLDPANELVTRLGMQADHAAGDIASLHRRYRRLEKILVTEFGVKPSGETRELMEELTIVEDLPRRVAEMARGAASAPPPPPLRGTASGAVTGPPMIVVSPLAFGEDDQMGEEFADICTEDIRGRLTAYRDLRVVALEASDMERVVSVCQGSVAAYLMSGRVRRVGNDLRINLQIGHIADTVIIWSETVTVALGALSGAVSQVVGRAVGAVMPVIDRDLSRRLSDGVEDDADCVVLYAKARALVREARNLAETMRGAEMLQRVVDADARHVSARLLLAQLYNTDFWQQLAGHDVAAYRAKALQLVSDAAKTEPENLRVRVRLAWCHIRAANWSAAERLLRLAMDAAPFDADAMNECGCAYYHLGNLDAAGAAMQQAFILNPFPPSDYHGDYAIIEALRGRREAAEEHFVVAGSQTLHYLAVRIANLAAMQYGREELPTLVERFRAAFLVAWQQTRTATKRDIIDWIRYTIPLRETEHGTFITSNLISALGGGQQA